MKLLDRISYKVRNYPFWWRLPVFAAMVCLFASDIYKYQSAPRTEILVMVVLCLAALCGYRTRLFSFLVGIGLGAALATLLPHLHF